MAIDFSSFLDVAVPNSLRLGIREPAIAAATGRHETSRIAAASFRRRQAVLGIGIQDLARVAGCTAHRKARYRGPLAPGPVSQALGSQVPVQRTTQDRSGGQGADSADVPSQPAVGRASDSR